MGIMIAVGSEEQINTGAAWCASIDGITAENLTVAVLGTDRKALAEYVRKTLATELECEPSDLSISTIESDAAAILDHMEENRCRSLLLIHEVNASALQRDVFQTSKHPTLWLRASGKPPESDEQVISAFQKPTHVTSVVAQKLLGFAPTRTLCADVDLQRDNLSEALKSAITDEGVADNELILFGIDDPDSSDRVYKTGLILIDSKTNVSLGLLHDGYTVPERIASKVYHWAASVAPPLEPARKNRSLPGSAVWICAQPRILRTDFSSCHARCLWISSEFCGCDHWGHADCSLDDTDHRCWLGPSPGQSPSFSIGGFDHHSRFLLCLDRQHAIRLAGFDISGTSHDFGNASKVQTVTHRLLCRLGRRTCCDLCQNAATPLSRLGRGRHRSSACSPDFYGRPSDRIPCLDMGHETRRRPHSRTNSTGSGQCPHDHGWVVLCALGTRNANRSHTDHSRPLDLADRCFSAHGRVVDSDLAALSTHKF